MQTIALYVDDVLYLKFAFLMFKIISCIQNDIKKKSPYWKLIKIENTEEKWDFVIQNEINSLDMFGRMVK